MTSQRPQTGALLESRGSASLTCDPGWVSPPPPPKRAPAAMVPWGGHRDGLPPSSSRLERGCQEQPARPGLHHAGPLDIASPGSTRPHPTPLLPPEPWEEQAACPTGPRPQAQAQGQLSPPQPRGGQHPEGQGEVLEPGPPPDPRPPGPPVASGAAGRWEAVGHFLSLVKPVGCEPRGLGPGTRRGGPGRTGASGSNSSAN